MTSKSNRLPLMTSLLLIFAASLPVLPARALNAVRTAQQVLRRKILREAGDRYDVQFLSAHTDRLPGGLRIITGRGRFRRRGAEAQNFTYHASVSLHDAITRDVGYVIR